MDIGKQTPLCNELKKLVPCTRILVIEDDRDDIYLLTRILHEDPARVYETDSCHSLQAGLQKLAQHDYDVILLDLGLPDSQGLPTLEKLHTYETYTPIIVLTGINDERLGEQAIKKGAEDFLPKAEMTHFMLKRALSYTIERHKMRQHLMQKAYEDALTGLLNRSSLFEKLELLVSQCQRNAFPLAIALMDLDGFKQINDNRGHQAGDDVLRAVGQRLMHQLRASDLAARYGGDEFVLIFTNYRDNGSLHTLLSRKHQELTAPITLEDGSQVCVGASIGVCEFDPQQPIGADELIKRADAAMYHGKQNGKNTICFSTDTPSAHH